MPEGLTVAWKKSWFSKTGQYLGGDEAAEMPVDPATYDDHWQDVGQVSLQHVGHHRRVSHRVRGRGSASLENN